MINNGNIDDIKFSIPHLLGARGLLSFDVYLLVLEERTKIKKRSHDKNNC